MATQTWAIIVMAVVSVLAATATFLMKLAAPKLALNIKKLIKNRNLIIGLFIYGFATLISIAALKAGELSVLYPIVALQYVWTNFLSMKYLKEKITFMKWAGIAMIIIGVAMIGMKA
jgi:drug/metabolite transporter (DMT)-like permease